MNVWPRAVRILNELRFRGGCSPRRRRRQQLLKSQRRGDRGEARLIFMGDYAELGGGSAPMELVVVVAVQ